MFHAAASILGSVGHRVLSSTWHALAYAERYQGALLAEQAVGGAMNKIGSYIDNPGDIDPSAIPIKPLASQIANEWARPLPLPTTIATVDAKVTTAPQQQTTPPSPEPVQAPPPPESSQEDQPTRVVGAPKVNHARSNPIAPHAEKRLPNAHEKIGYKYQGAAARAIGQLGSLHTTSSESVQKLASDATELLTKCVAAIETGTAREEHFHAIEQLSVVPHILDSLKHKNR